MIICKDIIPFSPETPVGVQAFANCISGSFTYPSAVEPCSILKNNNKVIFSDACHAWLGFPETVIYRLNNGTFGIRKCLTTGDLPVNVKWAVGGMGLLDFYNPAEEGFDRFTKNGKTYDYSDVLRDTDHTVLGMKDDNCYLIYCESMTGSQVNTYCRELGLEMAIMLDGGHIAAINSDSAKINTAQRQGYMIQGIDLVVEEPTGGGTVSKKLVALDAGHNEVTSGKRSPDESYFEYEFNIDVREKIKTHLLRHDIDVLLVDSDSSSSSTELKEIVLQANQAQADIYVSIHTNAWGDGWTDPTGWEVLCYKLQGEGKKLADAIHEESIPFLGLEDRGVKDGSQYYVIRMTQMPSVIIEHGFHSNKEEVELLKSQDFREKCALADAKGIVKYFGLTWIDEEQEVFDSVEYCKKKQYIKDTIDANKNITLKELCDIIYNYDMVNLK